MHTIVIYVYIWKFNFMEKVRYINRQNWIKLLITVIGFHEIVQCTPSQLNILIIKYSYTHVNWCIHKKKTLVNYTSIHFLSILPVINEKL